MPYYYFLLSVQLEVAQVGDIKSASSGNARAARSDRETGDGGAATYFFFNFLINNLAALQQRVLQKTRDQSFYRFSRCYRAALTLWPYVSHFSPPLQSQP
ncbi:MAG: hypothetical protein ACKOC0_01475 [Cytophagales bacterium]